EDCLELEGGRRGGGVELQLSQPFMQRAELERGEELANSFLIPRLEAIIHESRIQRYIVEQTPDLFIDAHLVGTLFDGLAEFWRKLVGVGNDLLNVAVFVDELRRGLVPHTRNAGQIV